MKYNPNPTKYKLYFDNETKQYKEERIALNTQFPFEAYIRESAVEGMCPPHWHENIEIICVLRGTIRHTVGGGIIDAGKDDIIIIHPCCTHSWEALTDQNVDLFVIQFMPEAISPNWLNTMESQYILPFIHHSGSDASVVKEAKRDYPQIYGIISCIYEEYNKKEKGYELFIKGYILQLIASMVRNNLIQDKNKHHIDKDLQKIDPLLRYVENNYASKIRLEEVAKMLNYDYYYMSKIFKRITGKTFTDYLHNVRIYEAEKLMLESEMNLTEIAYAVGFENVASFNRTFRKIRNTTPNKVKSGLYYSNNQKTQNMQGE